MRLLNAETFQLEDFFHESVPPYVVLSHTWGRDSDEISFRDVQAGRIKDPATRPLKLSGCCKKARDEEFKYVWIDTCCIDKTNAVELGEAINSMFRWYRNATLCFAYLSDVPADDNPRDPNSKFSSSRWFERGWTLQELLAPSRLRFYNAEWQPLGTKGELCTVVEKVTGVPSPYLLGVRALQDASVAQRMSWAAKRITKRREDSAYCLLGIFGVTMPMIYGEGGRRAFRRLQEQIMKDIPDDSILAWSFNQATPDSPALLEPGGILATSPGAFIDCRHIIARERTTRSLFDVFGGSLRLHIPMFTTPAGVTYGVLRCGSFNNAEQVVGIPLAPLPVGLPNEYFRPHKAYTTMIPRSLAKATPTTILIPLEHTAAVLSTNPKKYWFHIQGFVEMGLDLVDVDPRPWWRKEEALIEAPVSAEEGSVRYILLRFRSQEPGSDFLIILETSLDTSKAGTTPPWHVMTCAQDTPLALLRRKVTDFRGEAMSSQSASNGMLSLQIVLEPIPEETMFCLRPVALSGAPQPTYDAAAELMLLDLNREMDILKEGERGIEIEAASLADRVNTSNLLFEETVRNLRLVDQEIKALERRRALLRQEMNILDANIGDLSRSGLESRSRWRTLRERRASTQKRLDALSQRSTVPVSTTKSEGSSETSENDTSLVLWAASTGHAQILRRLLEDGDDAEPRASPNGETALHLAAKNDRRDVAAALLEHGVSINTTDNLGKTALFHAIESGKKEMALLLHKNGADHSLRVTENDESVLHAAVRSGSIGMTQLLLSWPIDKDAKDKRGQTALLHAVHGGHENIVATLLAEGADSNASSTKTGWSPLHVATAMGSTSMTRLLLDGGANVNIADRFGETPLFQATRRLHEATFLLLLERGASMDVITNDQERLLPVAVKAGFDFAIRTFLEKGGNIESKDKYGGTMLHEAVECGKMLIVKLLVEKGADVRAVDAWNKTPLMLAAGRGYEEVVRLLLDKGAEIEAKDYRMRTALFFACEKGRTEVVRMLLSRDVVMEAWSESNHVPLTIAIENGHSQIAEMLLASGAAANTRNIEDWTSLHSAASAGNESVLQLILKKGGTRNLHRRAKSGQTPLDCALKNKHQGAAAILLSKGAKPSQPERIGEGSTAANSMPTSPMI